MNTIVVMITVMLSMSQVATMPSNLTEKELTLVVIEQIADKYPTWHDDFQLNVWDCSEMSAYVSYRLRGFDIENEIVVGYNGHYYHAWVTTKDTVIECTSLTVYADKTYYFSDRPHWNYKDFDVGNWNSKPNEWDWWNSPIFN